MKKELPMAGHSPVIAKTVELCQTILDQPAYEEMREVIAAFLRNETLRDHYEKLCDLQETLHHKQDEGGEVTDDELAAFEALEREFLSAPETAPFIEAQQKMHQIEQTVMDYLRKTFELGRVPTEADLEAKEGCGPGCGCHG